jgi:hypothetical protein
MYLLTTCNVVAVAEAAAVVWGEINTWFVTKKAAVDENKRYTNLISPRSTVHVEMLTVVHLIKELLPFVKPEGSLSCSQMVAMESYPAPTQSYLYLWEIGPYCNVILIFKPRFHARGSFVPSFATKILKASLIYPLHSTCPALLTVSDLSTVTKLNIGYKL